MKTKYLKIYFSVVFFVYILYLMLNYFKIDPFIFVVISQVVFIFIIALGFYIIAKLNTQYNTTYLDSKKNESVQNVILGKSPNGIVILNSEGRVEYVNQAVGRILGSTETLGMNIFEFNTVKDSRLYNSIKKALLGSESEIKNEMYTSCTSGETKYLNFYVYPIYSFNFTYIEKVIIMFNDISEEIFLRNKMESNYLSTIETFADLVDARDSYTGEHSKKVLKYVNIILSQLCLEKSDEEEIRLAASFHDIGKIGISDKILNKPGPLSDYEFEIMKKHPSLGANIIKKIDDFEKVSKIIRYHHERWDGNGYPDGLKGNEIPLGAQIISIADAFDAITSDRIYRKALGKDAAIKILLQERGKQFNGELVDIFLKRINKMDISNIA